MSRFKSVLPVAGISAIHLAMFAGMAAGATITKSDFVFVKVADTTSQGFTGFGNMPAINNDGLVAFVANRTGFTSGGVFRWNNNILTTIAPITGFALGSFGASLAINPGGLVGFSAKVTATNDSIIATGEGVAVTTIASATQQGLVGGQFLGFSAMNASGTAAFLAFRTGFASQAIFAGNGGPLKVLIDTKTDPNFGSLGNVAINASGRFALRGFRPDGSVGIFTGDGGRTVVADSNNPSFFDFLDPVINNSGTVASAAFLNAGPMEVFTGDGKTFTPRTNPSSAFFPFVDNVSINNSGDVAFFAGEATGGQGIFLEATGGDSPVPVIENGDPLFGSTVTSCNVGRFSLNDSDQISFQFVLADGRSGIAIAYPQRTK